MTSASSASVVEDAALAWLEALGYAVLHGPNISAGEPGAERGDPDYRDVSLKPRLPKLISGELRVRDVERVIKEPTA